MTHSRLEQLYDRHAAGLFHYVREILRDEQSAKDVLQDVFVKLARLGELEVENEKAWIYRIAHNRAVDLLRRTATRRGHREETSRECMEICESTSDIEAADLGRRLEEALCQLPPEQQSVTRLRLWQEMTFEEIAEVQGIPMNTAASRFRYALEKLRTRLRPLYEELK